MKTAIHRVELSSALRRMLHDRQIFCTPDCCKERAFEITEGTIARWLEGERIDRTRELAEEIGRIARDLRRCEGRIFLTARDLESGWDLDDFRAFWEHLETTFASAILARDGNGSRTFE